MTLPRATRAIAAFVDQFAFSSLSFATTLMVAQEATAAQFGTFALLQLGSILLVGLARTTVGHSTLLEQSSRGYGVSTTGALLTFVVGIVASAGFWVPHLVLGSTVSLWLGLVGLSLGPVMVLDVARHALHGANRSVAASAVSAVAAVAYSLVVGAGLSLGAPLALAALSAMAVGPCAGIAIAGLAVGTFDRPEPLRIWTQQRASEWRHAGLGFMANSAGFVLVPVIMAAIAGSAAAGALRAGQVIVGFAQQFPNSVSMLMLERSARAVRQRSPQTLRRLLQTWIAVSLPMFAGLLGVTVLYPGLGEAALGETWPQASRIVVPLVVSGFVSSVSLGIELQLRALGAARVTALARTSGATSVCVLVAGGSYAHGLVGGAVGLLLGNLVQAALMAIGRAKVIGDAPWRA